MTAGPGGREVGRVSVRVVPDFSGFPQRLRNFLNRQERDLELEVDLGLDQSSIRAFRARVAAIVESAERNSVDIDINVDEGSVRRSNRRLREFLSAVNPINLVRDETEGINNALARLAPIAAGARAALVGFAGALALVAAPAALGAILAAPAALTALVAPIGAVALGAEGIAEAFEEAAPQVRVTQGLLSETFSRELRDDAGRLSSLLASFTPSLIEIANTLTDASDELTRFLFEPEQRDRLTGILDQVNQLIGDASDSLIPLVDGVIELVDRGLGALQRQDFDSTREALGSLSETIDRLSEAERLDSLLESLDRLLAFGVGFIDLGLRVIEFVDIAENGFIRVLEAFEEMEQALRDDAENIRIIPQIVIDAFDFMARASRRFEQEIDDAFGGVRGSSSALGRSFNGLGRIGSTAVSTLSASASSSLSALRSALSNSAGAAGRFAGSVASSAGRAISSIASIPRRAAGALGNVGSLLVSAGSRLVGGFIRGIQGRFSGVRATLSRLTSLLPSWKGPASRDRRILSVPARNIMTGFAEDLERNFQVVERRLGDITGDISSSVSTVAGSGSTGTNVIVNADPRAAGGFVREVTRAAIRGTNQALALQVVN